MEWLDVVLLSRLQFTLTAVIHYLFIPLTLGMAVLIAYMEFKYWRTNDALYDKMARFWTKLFLINFAVGVATGITMEFQFGTNWSDYSRYVGDIFGAPLAAEGIFAFFLESTFIGLLVFGRDKISRGLRFFAALMVAFGTNMSAFWIVAANSWMQTPAGFMINDTMGRAEMTNFAEVIFNPSTLVRLSHVLEGAYITAAFFVIAISAYYLLKKKNIDIAKESMKIAIVFGMIFSLLQLVSGHSHAALVAETQPAKLAAYEAHWETKPNAPLLLFAIPDYENETNKFEIGIPSMLSFLAFNDPDATVTGLQDIPKDERPNILGNFFSFRIMVGMGSFFIVWTILLAVLLKRGKLYDNTLVMKAAVWLLPLPYIANSFGWILAEWGRQPWIVYGLLKTSDAVSHVSSVEVLISLVLFLSIYAFLLFLMIYLMVKEVKRFNSDVNVTIDRPIDPAKGVTL
jgi:cytochrome d ubiquinol oxidase subunit I